MQSHSPILIDGDANFSHRNGVSRGKGTIASPYVIENLDINASLARCSNCRGAGLEIRNTQSYFVVRNVYIHSGSLAPFGNSGINLYNITNGKVQMSTFLNNAVGILGRNVRNSTINDNSFLGQQWGIALSSSSALTISGNQISLSSVSGIQIGEVKGGQVAIVGNTVSNSSLSGIMTFANMANVTRNVVRNSGWFGIYDLSDNSIITSNNVSSSGRIGLQIQSGMSHVSLNVIDGNQLGVLIWLSGSATLAQNRISGSGIGIESALISGVSGTASVYHNNFLQNGINAEPGVNVVWDAGYPAGGNYWSDYPGVDNCTGINQNVCNSPDGIGDTPYYSLGVLLDHYPLMKPFTLA